MTATRLSLLSILLLGTLGWQACITPPPAAETNAAMQQGVVAMRSAFLNQTALAAKLIDEAEARGAPPESVRVLRTAKQENADHFQAVYGAEIALLVEQGKLTLQDATFLLGATAAEIQRWKESRR